VAPPPSELVLPIPLRGRTLMDTGTNIETRLERVVGVSS